MVIDVCVCGIQPQIIDAIKFKVVCQNTFLNKTILRYFFEIAPRAVQLASFNIFLEVTSFPD